MALDEERLWVYPMVHAVAALVPTSRSDTVTAASHLDLARQCSQRLSSPASELLIALAQSRADHPGMRWVLEPLVSAPRVGLIADAGAHWWPLSIEALIGTGQLRDAAMLLREWASRIEDCGAVHLRMLLGWLHGWLCEQQGAPEQAHECSQRVLALTDSDAPPLSLARLRMRYGCLPQAAGDRLGARAQLKEAYHRLAALGAAPYLRRVEAPCTAPLRGTRWG